MNKHPCVKKCENGLSACTSYWVYSATVFRAFQNIRSLGWSKYLNYYIVVEIWLLSDEWMLFHASWGSRQNNEDTQGWDYKCRASLHWWQKIVIDQYAVSIVHSTYFAANTLLDVHPVLGYCWPTVFDGGPAWTQHWVNTLHTAVQSQQ